MNTKWNPTQYEKFKDQRSKPFFELVSLIQGEDFESTVDLGCGTGELTRKLFDRLHPEKMVGIDSSREMLERSVGMTAPGLRFELKDISDYTPENGLDLVFSNAALQWLPGHESLFPKILGWIRPNGQVAIQMPFNFDHPSHQIARSIALRLFPSVFPASPHFSGTLPVESYSQMLFQNGFERQICRVEVYGHPLSSGHEVIEWTKGTLLTAYEERLSEEEFALFVDSYRRELIESIGESSYYYAFKRILLWGRKK